jgi:hypothetical protein
MMSDCWTFLKDSESALLGLPKLQEIEFYKQKELL